jgi:hypothetical protein
MPPPENEEAPARQTGAISETSSDTNQTDNLSLVEVSDRSSTVARADLTSSQQVSWWTVHEHVTPLLVAAGSWPMAGTPAWCALDDHDPVKTAALLDAARHWVLRVETHQQAQCEASRDVCAAADWAAIAQEIKVRNEVYAERPWLKRSTTT